MSHIPSIAVCQKSEKVEAVADHHQRDHGGGGVFITEQVAPPEATVDLSVPHSDVILGQTQQLLKLFLLYSSLNFTLYISKVTIVTMFFPLCVRVCTLSYDPPFHSLHLFTHKG